MAGSAAALPPGLYIQGEDEEPGAPVEAPPGLQVDPDAGPGLPEGLFVPDEAAADGGPSLPEGLTIDEDQRSDAEKLADSLGVKDTGELPRVTAVQLLEMLERKAAAKKQTTADIPIDEQYSPSDYKAVQVLEGFGQPQNIGFSYLLGKIRDYNARREGDAGVDAGAMAKEAFDKKRQTTPGMIRRESYPLLADQLSRVMPKDVADDISLRLTEDKGTRDGFLPPEPDYKAWKAEWEKKNPGKAAPGILSSEFTAASVEETDWGDLIDVARDLPVTVLVDPVFGMSKLVSGAVKMISPAAKAGPIALKAIAESKDVLAPVAKSAERALTVGRIGGAGIAGIAATGMPGEDTSPATRLAMGIGTGLGVYFGAKAMPDAKAFLAQTMDGTVNGYMKWSRGLQAEGTAEARRLLTEGSERIKRDVTIPFLYERLKAISNLPKEKLLVFTRAMDEKLAEFVGKRNDLYGQVGEELDQQLAPLNDLADHYSQSIAELKRRRGAVKPLSETANQQYLDQMRETEERLLSAYPERMELDRHVISSAFGAADEFPILKGASDQIGDAIELFEKRLAHVEEAAQPLKSRRRVLLNGITAQLNKEMDTPEVWAALIEAHGSDVADAMQAAVRANKEFARRYNAEVLGITKEPDILKKGMPGIWFHNDNPQSVNYYLEGERAFKEADEAAKALLAKETKRSKARIKFKMKTVEGRTVSADELDPRMGYAIYIEDAAKKWLKPLEVEAMRKLALVESLPIRDSARKLEGYLEVYDWALSRWKQNVLSGSLSWLKNNLADGLSKSFIMNDMAGMVKGRGEQMTLGLLQDLASTDAERIMALPKNPRFRELQANGIISGGNWKEGNKHLEAAFDLDTGLSEAKTTADKARWLGEKAANVQNLVTPFGTAGRVMEDYFRSRVYFNVYDVLERSLPGLSRKALEKVAAKVTRDTFFDYHKVHDFERAVLRRAVPFYTFYSRSLNYWVNSLTHGTTQAPIVAMESIKRGIGRSPTRQEREEIPDYQSMNPRVLSGRTQPTLEVLDFPNTPMYDILSFMDMGKGSPEFMERSSPYLQMLQQYNTGRDPITNQPLLPSEAYSDTKTEFKMVPRTAGARGYTKAWANKKLEARGWPLFWRDMLGIGGSAINPKTGKAIQTRDESVVPGIAWDLVTPPWLHQVANPYLRYTDPDMNTEYLKGNPDRRNAIPNMLMGPQFHSIPEEQRETNPLWKKRR